jgi:hypothetical protein
MRRMLLSTQQHSSGRSASRDGAARYILRNRSQLSLWRPAPSIAVRLDRASSSGHRVDSDITGGGRRHIGRWNVRVVIARHDIGRWRGNRHIAIARCRRHNNGRSRINRRSNVDGRRRVRFHNIDALCLRRGRSNQCQRRNCSSQHVVCHGPHPVADSSERRTRSGGISSEWIKVQSGPYGEESRRPPWPQRERCRQKFSLLPA